MASVYDLKPKFQNLLRPLCGALARAGITANQVTVFAALLSLAEGAAIFCTQGARWALLLLPVVLFVRMALNAIDGMLAREFGQKSKLGAILNELGDVVSDAALYLAFITFYWSDLFPVPLAITAFVVIAVMTEMTGVIAVQIGAARQYQGPMGKSDRALWVGVYAVFLVIDRRHGVDLIGIYFAFLALLGLWTIINRARAALKDDAP